MKQKMRSLGKKLELATYARDKVVTFTFANHLTEEGRLSEGVAVPLPIMYRYYHVGRAYDLHQLKHLHPTGKITLDFIATQLLIQELEQVSDLVEDPVLHHYSGLLVPYLKTGRSETKDNLVIKSPM